MSILIRGLLTLVCVLLLFDYAKVGGRLSRMCNRYVHRFTTDCAHWLI